MAVAIVGIGAEVMTQNDYLAYMLGACVFLAVYGLHLMGVLP